MVPGYWHFPQEIDCKRFEKRVYPQILSEYKTTIIFSFPPTALVEFFRNLFSL